MFVRSAHTKSRNGCGQCKKRHIRCNLQPPICANCKKRGQTCDYQSLSTREHPLDNYQPGGTVVAVPNRVFVPGHTQIFGSLDVSPATLLSLVDGEGLILNNEFSHAVDTGRQRFLEHNLLAIGSLYAHIRSTVPTPELYIAALTHHTEASRLFRRSVKKINEQNWVAAMGFAISVVVFHLNIAQKHDSDSIMETMFVLRNSALIGHMLAPWYNRSRIRMLVESHMHECISRAWLEEVVHALNILETTNTADKFTGNKARSICLNATRALRQWVDQMDGYPRAWTHFLWWPATVSTEYLKLLARGNPGALIVFVHWCAIMRRAPKRWFLDGWATRVASSAVQCLGPGWDARLVWPLKVLGLKRECLQGTVEKYSALNRASRSLFTADHLQH